MHGAQPRPLPWPGILDVCTRLCAIAGDTVGFDYIHTDAPGVASWRTVPANCVSE
jgi:hypothetical protein